MVENLMTLKNTAITNEPDQPEHMARPVPEQLSLEELPVVDPGAAAEASTDDTSATVNESTRRAFVPSNRERILQQLGALVLSPDFPPSAGTPAGASRAPLVIHDGLRTEEIDILAGGRPQRFPVLAEIRSEACLDGASAFGIQDVVALHFRTEEEASDFRFRPVDELNTEYLRCTPERSLFALDGASRFASVGPATAPERSREASSADRIAGAISCVLELAAIDPGCTQPVADLLSGGGPVPWLNCIDGFSTTTIKSGPAGAHAAIVRAFIEHEGGSPSRLVAEIGRQLDELSDPDVAPTIPAWLHRAEAVLSNQMVLDGKILSDDGMIALRAAILAAVVDDVQDLVAFLNAARPAGRQVVVAAAFLIGLKTGVADLSWHRKLPRLDLLSPLLVALHHPDQATRATALSAFQPEPDESVSPFDLVLYWRDQQLLRWTPPQPTLAVPAPVPLAEYPIVECEVPAVREETGTPECADRMHSLEGPDGRTIKVTPAASDELLTSLCLALGENDRLRKHKEILEAACTPGICWRVGVTAAGTGALYADISSGAADDVMEAMILKLPAALSLYLAPVKPKGRARKTKAKAASKDPV
jgi:hypothetical protein